MPATTVATVVIAGVTAMVAIEAATVVAGKVTGVVAVEAATVVAGKVTGVVTTEIAVVVVARAVGKVAVVVVRLPVEIAALESSVEPAVMVYTTMVIDVVDATHVAVMPCRADMVPISQRTCLEGIP